MSTTIDRPFTDEARHFLGAHPDLERVEVLYSGFNGVMRGKWLPADALPGLGDHKLRMPISTVALDIWGNDVAGVGLALEKGDPDGIGMPIAGTLKRIPWMTRPSAQVMITLHDIADDSPSPYEPRHVLQRVVERFDARGLTPVVATELEFFLIDEVQDAAGHPRPPLLPGTEVRLRDSQVYDLDVLTGFERILSEVSDTAAAQGIPADTVVAEFGPGQFEINLRHVPSALQAADHCVLLKRAVKSIARKHGYRATFMAKPYGGQPGSGTHVHTSILDAHGHNIFSDSAGVDPRGSDPGASNGGPAASASLRHAVGGMLHTMRPFQLIWAPHANSYRRFQRASYAPVTPCWGYDNRAAAIRIPVAEGPAARFEHRVPGADANPYLVIAAILSGVLDGLEQGREPGPAVTTLDDVYALPPLSPDWRDAIDAFDDSRLAAEVFGSAFRDAFAASARAEWETIAAAVTDVECNTYLHRV